jgi:tetratricopeptide (TPR) repeat protein
MSKYPSNRKAFALYQAHDYTAACDAFEAYLSMHDAADWRAKLWYARALAESGQSDLALAMLESAAESHPERAAAITFKALILYDDKQYDLAERAGEDAYRRGAGVLALGICLLSRVRQGQTPMREMLRLLGAGNAELKGRALHVAEGRLVGFPRDVRRDAMDEVGVGWPGYAFLPPWLFKRSRLERRIWRLLGGGKSDEALGLVAERARHPEELSRGERESMVAAAIMADEWESASEWALTLEEYRSYVTLGVAAKGLALFQLSLFRGICLLMTGDPDESLKQFEIARERDSTSYLPHYFGAKAHVMLDNAMLARRGFVAACDGLNPSLASLRWEELLSNSHKT